MGNGSGTTLSQSWEQTFVSESNVLRMTDHPETSEQNSNQSPTSYVCLDTPNDQSNTFYCAVLPPSGQDRRPSHKAALPFIPYNNPFKGDRNAYQEQGQGGLQFRPRRLVRRRCVNPECSRILEWRHLCGSVLESRRVPISPSRTDGVRPS